MRKIILNRNSVFRYLQNTCAAFLSLILLLFFSVTASAGIWSGKCVAVTDGDTIKVMHNGKAEKIRLYGIDCPEKRQAFGTKAKQFTSEQVFGKVVEVKPVSNDRYGRTIAWVQRGDMSINHELIRAGLAWHYKHYSNDKDLAGLENEARLKRVGLWRNDNQVPPWEWRKEARLKHR